MKGRPASIRLPPPPPRPPERRRPDEPGGPEWDPYPSVAEMLMRDIAARLYNPNDPRLLVFR